ncbi:MAG: PIN domain-containing protein [Chloroflexota bacterium]|nr:PIN domain-containing protein [Chloroflexota bacterium]
MSDSLPIAPQPAIAFVDSSAIVALVDRRDPTHQQALAAYHELVDEGYCLFTTNYVIAETLQLLDLSFGPDIARKWLQDHRLPVYHADEQDERRATNRLSTARPGSRLSMTDAISSVVMDRLGVSDAFAVDADFLSDGS